MNTMPDCHIIGAGIIGLMTARQLLKNGLSVCVIEKGQTGKEASWASGGILSPLYPWEWPEAVTSIAIQSMSEYPNLADELIQESGIDPEYEKSGLLILDKEKVDEANQWATRLNQTIEILDRKEINRYSPLLNCEYDSAIWYPDIAHIRPPRLMKALKESVLKFGGVIFEETEITSIEHKNNKVIGLKTCNSQIPVSTVIVATGAWTQSLMLPLGLSMDIEPVRGQIIAYQTDPGFIKPMIMHKRRYLIPRRDGCILVGSTLEYEGFNKETTDEGFTELKESAVTLIPEMSKYPIEHHWAGLRPGKKNGIPVISKHPEIEGLYINAGHFRNGVVLAPISARLISEIVVGKEPIVDLKHYTI
jgi:glycine oxidase